MRHSDATGVVGVGLLITGLILFKLFDRWYHGVLGPFFWMMGCVLMITWALGRVGRRLQRRASPPPEGVAAPPENCH